MPAIYPISSLGKAIYDPVSAVPIYGGSTPKGVYVDEIWIDSELVAQRGVAIIETRDVSGSSMWFDGAFSSAYAKLLGSYSSATHTAISLASTDALTQTIYTDRYNIPTYTRSYFSSTFAYPAYICKVPSTYSSYTMAELYVSFTLAGVLGFVTDAFVFLVDTVEEAEALLLSVPYSGYSSISLDTQTAFNPAGKLLLIVPNVFSSSLSEGAFTKTTDLDQYGDPYRVVWDLAGASIVVNQIRFRLDL